MYGGNVMELYVQLYSEDSGRVLYQDIVTADPDLFHNQLHHLTKLYQNDRVDYLVVPLNDYINDQLEDGADVVIVQYNQEGILVSISEYTLLEGQLVSELVKQLNEDHPNYTIKLYEEAL